MSTRLNTRRRLERLLTTDPEMLEVSTIAWAWLVSIRVLRDPSDYPSYHDYGAFVVALAIGLLTTSALQLSAAWYRAMSLRIGAAVISSAIWACAAFLAIRYSPFTDRLMIFSMGAVCQVWVTARLQILRTAVRTMQNDE